MARHFNWTRGHVVQGLHLCFGLTIGTNDDFRLGDRLAAFFCGLHDLPIIDGRDAYGVVIRVARDCLVAAICLDFVRRRAGLTVVGAVGQFSDVWLSRRAECLRIWSPRPTEYALRHAERG